MRRDLTVLAAWFAVSVGALLAVRLRPPSDFGFASQPGGPPHSEDIAGRALPTVQELHGLRFAAEDGRPAWSAARAVPGSSAAPLGLAGLWHGLDLEDVRVDLGDGMFLLAATGRLVGRALDLGPLHGEIGGRRLLVAVGAGIAVDGEVRLAGPVVFQPGDPQREDILRDWSGSAADLAARLRR